MGKREMTALFVLASLWGTSFLFIRIASPAVGPFLTMEIRVFIGFLVMFLLAKGMRKTLQIKKYWKHFLLIGTVNAAIPFTLIAVAALELNASMTSILNSTTPLFGALVAWMFLGERFTVQKGIGMALGMGGVIALVGWNSIPVTWIVILSASCSILAALSYAIAGVYIKKHLQGVDSFSMSVGQQLAASLLLFPFIFIPTGEKTWSPEVVFSLLSLGVLATAIAYLFYFYLIEHAGPTNTLTVTFLVPLFGVFWGAIFLNEPITVGTIVGLALILSSIGFITGAKLVKVSRSEESRV
ncbi:membrane protein [Bacillus coahuilensis m2-6]|uniref:DMT family transporter n=1 Tax=Bacillus coahuilensis TaxID=408580 RepID=UPI0007504640|nr:DMT family transporter [Bacillus coahuilensis]KUP05081.1 membrane protein [Bacillus coahuilensis m2-6]